LQAGDETQEQDRSGSIEPKDMRRQFFTTLERERKRDGRREWVGVDGWVSIYTMAPIELNNVFSIQQIRAQIRETRSLVPGANLILIVIAQWKEKEGERMKE
jgi:hypothetical protein